LGRIAGAALTSLSMCGCAGFWDEVTSRNFDIHHFWDKPNPFLVLQNSDDGDQRAKALRALREPNPNGSSPKDREAVLNILVAAASKERQFLCRMAAVESLGHFQDPRAVDGLTSAFYSSTTFSQDLATRLQVQAATALGNTHQPAAEQFLLTLVQEKPQTEGSDQEKQQNMDVRLAATRALGNFNDPRVAQLLQGMVKGEKDIALRDCAKDALLASSGQRPPLIDFKAVEELILPASFRSTDDSDEPVTPGPPAPVAGDKSSNAPSPAPTEPEKKRWFFGLF
jgi:HEAT repeat protein